MTGRSAARGLAVAAALCLPPLGALGAVPQPATRPRLVVVIVVDQMRGEWLGGPFSGRFEAGLKRLLDEGAIFEQAHHDYAQTETASGHATLATGAYASAHGIIGNDWHVRGQKRRQHACDDGTPAEPEEWGAPGCSPCQLQRETLGDWLKRASPKSRVYAVAMKRRASVLLGGFGADAAYWLWEDQGRFVSSAYYGRSEPAWVSAFNESGLAARLSARAWMPLFAERAAASAAPAEPGLPSSRAFLYEPRGGGAGPQAPSPRRLLATPYGEELVVRFVEELVHNERLGSAEAPDLLLVGLSAADAVGHIFGPRSPELEDCLLRVDGYVGELIDLLDAEVGRGRYLLALSSDHGVAELPESSEMRRAGARRVLHHRFRAPILTAAASLARDYRVSPPVVEEIGFEGVYLRFEAFDPLGVPRARVRADLAARLRRLAFVADAFTSDELLVDLAGEPRPYEAYFRRWFSAERGPDVTLLYRRNWLVDCGPDGTRHGTPYEYDTHVPLVFFGAGVSPGRHGQPTRAVDLAPTLADALRVAYPGDLDGKSLLGLVTGSEKTGNREAPDAAR